MKKRKALLLLLLAVVAAGLYYYFNYYQHSPTSSEITASGHIEVTEVDMSFRLPGHVVRLYVEEGDQVKKGQLIAELEQDVLRARRDQASARLKELVARQASLDTAIRIKEAVLNAEVKKAKAGVSAASARYLSLKTGSRKEEIAAAAAARDRAKTEWENRKRDLQRIKTLYERHIIPVSQYDAARTAEKAARAAYKAAEERYKLVKTGPRREKVLEGRANLAGSDAALVAVEARRKEIEKMKHDLKALQAQIQQAKAFLAMAQDDLDSAKLYAPFDGFVTVKDVEQGEFVQAGSPVLTLAKLSRVWVKTYVPETQLGRIRLGQNAEVLSDSFPGKSYPGRVTYISPKAEFTPKNIQTKEERVKLVYRIKVTLDNPNLELKAGMPVDVVLR
ncbi:MAG: efflux RND transporter periplasmic adaptor subunit [Deltaproteobacteria bacterium]|nr:efflux RND transporter periplasmic adaptor subunit [Deltaproteobacteria bacterium]MBW1934637.1 efflux RND transporter periplasmic adaptor subunit [Deltaproteobacteria bacterium]MBW1977367.1 efflux RND transporter periplasmic adaptor subunit [Deltaproteobacteria bacterium]MBW2044447.1 efflux RND transporter periplasmic adaptor subunit [Deltaproteobacteria bacterium]MBW2301200.1 efflux RND transporter periplasmic adaptor subunit [Deltaproteobacteria bacterium]